MPPTRCGSTVQVLFGTRHVAVTSVNAAGASGSAEIAAYPDQFELTSGVTLVARAPKVCGVDSPLAAPPVAATTASSTSGGEERAHRGTVAARCCVAPKISAWRMTRSWRHVFGYSSAANPD